MPIVIADTGPINYLVLIGHVDVLPVLFEQIIMPLAVRDELSAPAAPLTVRNWIAIPPARLELRAANQQNDASLADLGAGESYRQEIMDQFLSEHGGNG